MFDNTENFYVCMAHKTKSIPTIIEKNMNDIKIIDDKEVDDKCILCDKKALFTLSTNAKYKWCDIHYQKNGKSFQKKIIVKKISTNCNKQPLQSLIEKLYNKLDSFTEFLHIDEVLIENQPSLHNPTMKTISTCLYSYFIMRGIIDKDKMNSMINFIKFVSPSNKLKVDAKNTSDILDKKQNSRKKYRLTKSLGIKYCLSLIENKDKDILKTYKKKDDMCDAFLQGFQYLFNPVPQIYIEKLHKI